MPGGRPHREGGGVGARDVRGQRLAEDLDGSAERAVLPTESCTATTR